MTILNKMFMNHRKQLFLSLSLFFGMITLSIGQEKTIVRDGGKFGVKNSQGEWVINPTYEKIERMDVERTYYLFFLKEGSNHLGKGSFIDSNYNENIDSETSGFVIADEDFYVLNIEEYRSLSYNKEDDEKKVPVIYLYHDDGVDIVNIQKNSLVPLGYVSGAEQKIPGYLHVSSGKKVGLYSLNLDIYELEVYYDKIFLPFEDTNQKRFANVNEKMVVEKRGKTGIFNLKSKRWIIEEKPGFFVNVLDKNCTYLILSNSSKEDLYHRDTKLLSEDHFEVYPFNEEVRSQFTSKYILCKADEDYLIKELTGKLIYQSKNRLELINDVFFTEYDQNSKGKCSLKKLSSPSNTSHIIDFCYIPGSKKYKEHFPGMKGYSFDLGIVVQMNGQDAYVFNDEALVPDFEDPKYERRVIVYGRKGNFSLIDLEDEIKVDLTSDEPASMMFHPNLYKKIYNYSNGLNSIYKTQEGHIIRADRILEWFPMKEKTGMKMMMADPTKEGNMLPLFEKTYKKILTEPSPDFLLARFQNDDGKYGVINYFGEEVIEAIYDELILEFDADALPVYKAKRGKMVGLVDHNGEILIPIQYKSIDVDPSLTSDFINPYYIAYYDKKKYDLFDKRGNNVIEHSYDLNTIHSDISKSKFKGYINRYEVTSKDGTHMKLVTLKDDVMIDAYEYNNRFENLVVKQEDGKAYIYLLDGDKWSENPYPRNCKIYGEILVSMRAAGEFILFNLKGRRVNEHVYSKVEFDGIGTLNLLREEGEFTMDVREGIEMN